MALPETVSDHALAQRALEQALQAAEAYAGKSRAAAQPSLPATADVIALFGFAGAFRRAELVMLDTAHYDSGGKAFAPTRPELTCAQALYAGGIMFCTRGSQ